VSLSSSEEDESRLSPTRGAFELGEPSRDVKVEPVRDGDWGGDGRFREPFELVADESEWVDVLEAMDVMVETEDSRSEWASVYRVVVISSSSGVLKDTRFSAGNMGRDDAILRGTIWLLDRMETTLWGCL
jgi:hypothetical protein